MDSSMRFSASGFSQESTRYGLRGHALNVLKKKKNSLKNGRAIKKNTNQQCEDTSAWQQWFLKYS
jgi:hypothetical protein